MLVGIIKVMGLSEFLVFSFFFVCYINYTILSSALKTEWLQKSLIAVTDGLAISLSNILKYEKKNIFSNKNRFYLQ